MLTVKVTPEYAAMQRAISAAPIGLSARMTIAARRELSGPWTQGVQTAAGAHPRHTVRNVASGVLGAGAQIVTGTERSIRYQAGAGGGELDPRWYEFGTISRDRFIMYSRRNRTRPGRHVVRRHTARQLPHFRKRGYAVYPTAATITPRIASLWVSIVYKVIADATEGVRTP